VPSYEIACLIHCAMQPHTNTSKPHSGQEKGNVPVEVTWTPPTRFIAAGRTRRRFVNELTQTKKRLKNLALASAGTPADTPMSSPKPSASPKTKLDIAPASGPSSEAPAASPKTPAPAANSSAEAKPFSRPGSPDVNTEKLGVLREWRGIAEDDTYDDMGQKTKPKSAMRLPAMLRAAGGVQFGNMIIGAKARQKARRLVRDMASTAPRDPDTSKLIPVDLENRRIGNGEREHVIVGINYEKAGHLGMAVKAFGKALVVVKMKHIIHICRGNVQFQRGKFFSAISDFSSALKCIEVGEDSINAHLGDVVIARYNRAMSLFRIGDDERGIEDLKFAVMCDPDNDSVRETLVMAHRRCGQYADAIEHCSVLHQNAKSLREQEEMQKLQESTISLELKRRANTSSDHIAVIKEAEARKHQYRQRPTTCGGSMSAKPPTNRPSTSPEGRSTGASTATMPSAQGSSGNSAAAPISLINSRFMAESYGSSGRDSVEKARIKTVEIRDYEFPNLKTMKEAYETKRLNDEVTQATMHLETFKHSNGFKRHLFDTLFIRLNPLQDALITLNNKRTQEQLKIISEALRGFGIFSKNTETELFDLAACVEYRTVTSKSTVFYQDDEVAGVLLLLSGQLQLRLESGQETKTLTTINPSGTYGELALLFRNKGSPFVKKLQKACRNEDLGSLFQPELVPAEDESDAVDDDDDDDDVFNPNDNATAILPRSLQAGSFMSCKVSSPSEIILILAHDFDRMLREQCEREFLSHLELVRASGVFTDLFTPQEMIRLTRMAVTRHYHQGDVIVTQGEEPDFLYFILKGICKVIKRPDPSEYLVRRLGELKETAQTFDQKYAFHHKLRGTFTPASEECRRNHPDNPHITAAEEEREATGAEIAKLTLQVKRVKAAEVKRREEEEEMQRLGRPVPNMSVDIATLNWPQIFGEVCVLQPEGGTSLGTVKAETGSEILCIHKVHLQTFQIDERLLARVKQRAVHYPPDETLVHMLESNQEWSGYKKGLMAEIPKDKWPNKGRSHS
jgi:CRP-like cAMP-binding protein